MISDRIEALITHFCKGNKSSFAQQIGVTPSVIGNITGERKGNPSFEVIQKILDAFASVNPDWFILDRGAMLRDSKNPEETTMGVTPKVTPISPAEESIIYNMYKDEKAEKERMIKDKDIKIDHLNSALAETKAELAVIKAQFSDYKTYSEEKLRQLEAGVPGGKTSAKHVSTKKHSSPNADDATSATAP